MMRKLPPCVFNIWERLAQFSFVDDTGGYRNTVTMKSGCFLGQRDEVRSEPCAVQISLANGIRSRPVWGGGGAGLGPSRAVVFSSGGRG